jgi:hypothetical protein
MSRYFWQLLSVARYGSSSMASLKALRRVRACWAAVIYSRWRCVAKNCFCFALFCGGDVGFSALDARDEGF